jgi:cation:H+ antiporter
LSAAFGVVMLGLVAMSLVLGARAPALFSVGLYTPVLLALYLLALRSVFAHERSGAAPEPPVRDLAWRHEARRFGVAALAVLVAGAWLPALADRLAQEMGWSRSFVGTLFMAFVTTLPEMAVTLSALRIGALDMAIGNLLGSNLFNLTILAVDDLAYARGPLLADAAPVHAGSAAAAVLMTGLVMIGLAMRPRGLVLRITSWISIGLVAAYALNAAFVFLHGG